MCYRRKVIGYFKENLGEGMVLQLADTIRNLQSMWLVYETWDTRFQVFMAMKIQVMFVWVVRSWPHHYTASQP